MDEKLNQLLKLADSEKTSVSHGIECPGFSQFDIELPINTYEELMEIESKLTRDKTYHAHFVSIYDIRI